MVVFCGGRLTSLYVTARLTAPLAPGVRYDRMPGIGAKTFS